jgi:hypothetical protein
LSPITASSAELNDDEMQAVLKKNKCSFFNFVALYRAQGIHTTDGILGLAPRKEDPLA